jgi:hypothetical protein
MANRNRNFDEAIAKKMESSDFAQSFLLELMSEHGLSLVDALVESISAMGLSSYAERSDLSIQYVSDFVNGRKKSKVEIIDKFLRPFGLRVKLDVEKVA